MTGRTWRWNVAVGVAVVAFAAGALTWLMREGAPYPPGESESGRWVVVNEETHPFLKRGVTVVWWNSRNYAPGALVRTVRRGQMQVRVRCIADLLVFVDAIRNGNDAVELSCLLREFDIADSDVPGETLEPDETVSGLGNYARKDAERWGIPLEVVVKQVPEGYEIVRPVVSRMVTGGHEKARVYLIRETITTHGEYKWQEIRTLEGPGKAEQYVFRRS